MAKRNVPGVIDALRKAVDATFDDDKEYFGYTVKYTFERAVNDAVLGNGQPVKVATKPRKKRRSKPLTADQADTDQHIRS